MRSSFYRILADQGVQVVMVSDACRAGKLAGSDIGGAQATAANLATQFANEIKILSCQPNEFSLEGEQWGGGRGCFSYHLIEGLTGLADGNEDDIVNLLEINRYLEETVPVETAPQSQIPMTVGSKSAVVGRVDAASLAELRQRKEKSLPAITAIETKGFEQVVLAGTDSIWQKKYEQFTAALEKGELLEPAGASAYDLYAELSQVPELERLHGIMKRNLATALQDESQQAINAWLRADEEEMAARTRGDLKYTKFVQYLEKAAELLGESHYMYKTLKAKQYYFDALDIGFRFEWHTFSLADSSLIWKKQREEKIQKALELEENAAFILWEVGVSMSDTTTYYFKKAIELAPTWILPYTQITVPLRRAGKFEEALSYAAKAKELAPESSVAYAVAADIHASKGEHNKAEELFLKAVQISPRNVWWLKYLAQAYYNQGKLRDAEKTWLRIIELSPENNDTYNSLSQLYLSRTFEFDKSEAINRKRLEMRPTDGDAYSDLISTYWGRQPDKIRLLIDEMEKINASVENWEGQSSIGMAYGALGEPEKGIPYFQRAVQAAPKNTWHYYGFAGLYFQLGEYEKGLACLDTAFANGMDYGWVENGLGVERAYKFLGYQAFAQRVIDARPNMGFGYRLMAEYFKGKSEFEEAVAWYEQAVARSPEQFRCWINYVQSAYLMGRPEQADSIVQRHRALYPEEWRLMGPMGEFYKNHGEFEMAEPLIKAVIERVPTRMGAHRNLARLYYFFGKKQEAFAVLEEAKKRSPDDFNTIALIAVLRYFDEPASAKTYFDEATLDRTEFSTVWDCLEATRNDEFERAEVALRLSWKHFDSFWVEMVKYRFMQMKIRHGKKEEALQTFSWILRKGWFVEYQLFANDPELNPIRGMEAFQKLMKEYFPEKTKG